MVEIVSTPGTTPSGQSPALVRRESADGVVRLTLTRGARYNPLSREMIASLQAELDALAGDPSARVVVLAAEGRGFCAGHDLGEMRAHADDTAWQSALFAECNRLMVTLTGLPQPVIARVHGIATAAGCQLVSMCDLAVAADSARFALPGVNIGVFCSTPAVGVARLAETTSSGSPGSSRGCRGGRAGRPACRPRRGGPGPGRWSGRGRTGVPFGLRGMA